MSEPILKNFRTEYEMGLGEAITRHNKLHKLITSGIASKDQRVEYNLITDALNHLKIPLGFDCNEDGIPDSIEIFMKTSKTSCCRLVDTKGSRRKTKTTSRSKRKVKR